MIKNKQIYIGGFKYLFKNRSAKINFFITLILTIPAMFLINSKLLWDMGEGFVIYMFFAISLGLTLFNIQELILDLTMLDKLNKRIEFLLGNGLDLKDIVSNYSKLIFTISMIPSFILLIYTIVVLKLKTDIIGIIALYIGIILFSYSLIVLINILIFKVKRYKLLKNTLFFGTFLTIWLLSNFGQNIVSLIEEIGVSINMVLIITLFALALTISSFYLLNKKNLTNESALKVESKWE